MGSREYRRRRRGKNKRIGDYVQFEDIRRKITAGTPTENVYMIFIQSDEVEDCTTEEGKHVLCSEEIGNKNSGQLLLRY